MILVAARALQAAGPVRTVNDVEEIYTFDLPHSQSGTQPWRDSSRPLPSSIHQSNLSFGSGQCLSVSLMLTSPGGGHSVTSPGTIQVSALSPPF